MNKYDEGYKKGRKDEAEITLTNLLSLKSELDGVGYDAERSFLNTLIKDLEESE